MDKRVENLFEFKQNSGCELFASIYGASNIDPKAYLNIPLIETCIEDNVKILMKQDIGIMHGASPYGAMRLINEQALADISRFGLNFNRNIGIPHAHFDHYGRTEGAICTEPTTNILARLGLIGSGDFSVVCPVGGVGTFFEFFHIFHENYNRPSFNPALGDNDDVPLIFLQLPGVTDWKDLLQYLLNKLYNRQIDLNRSWLNFIEKSSDFEDLINNLKPSLLAARAKKN